MPTPSPEDHFARLARLLELEAHAEAQDALRRSAGRSRKDAERGGDTLIGLVVTDEHAGLGGRYLVRLAKAGRKPLPWTRLGVGSPIFLSPDDAPGKHAENVGYRGVVCELSDDLQVALAKLPDDLSRYNRWRIDLSDDEVSTARARDAMKQASAARRDRLAVLRDVLLGHREPVFGRDPDIRPLDTSLNATQVEAVYHALSAREVALIHGPPGTGKTTVVVELIRQAVRRGQKVLACAPSNLAVDNIFERLLRFDERVVRLGHPARVLPQLREHTLDLQVERHRDAKLAQRFVKQAMQLFREADRYTRAKPKPGHKRQLREDAKSLLADGRRLQSQTIESILRTADILCCTTTGVDPRLLGDRRFDLLVIDEACQSVEPGCWIPMLRCDRVVLAGDHCQLPPTILSRDAAQQGFSVSLFERLMAMRGGELSRRLGVQYRMHAAVMEYSSKVFYEGDLTADDSVAGHLLSDIPGVAARNDADRAMLGRPVEFIDTAGADFDEQREPDGESRRNLREAELVSRKVSQLLDVGVAPADIGVITPYSAQVRLLREQIAVEHLEIDSVDGFQGREKEAILLSLVRSNPQRKLGFLADTRRMNVAMTRARRKLLMIGDSVTLATHPFYRDLLEYFDQIGAYRSVWEEEPGV